MNQEIKSIQEDIHSKFAELKDGLRELAREESKGYVDCLLEEKINKINDSLAKADEKLEAAEKLEALSRTKNVVGETLEKSDLDKAFLAYIRKGDNIDGSQKQLLTEYSTKSMNSLSDTAGGYLVVPFLDTAITRRLYEISPMRSVATVKTISTDQYQKPQQTDLAQALWEDRDNAPVVTTAPTWGQLSIRVHGLYAMPEISTNLLDDAYIDVAAELIDSVSTAFEIAESDAFLNGSGTGRPRGLLTMTQGSSDTWGQVETVPSLSATAITANALTNLVYALKDGYVSNARFLMNRNTLSQIRVLVDSTGNALWTPQFGSEPATIMGYPVTRMAQMPNVAAGALAVAFGDFRAGYIVVDRMGIRILRDPYTNKPFVSFWTRKRVGGSPDNTESYKLLKVSLT